jgi:hypothetical protein
VLSFFFLALSLSLVKPLVVSFLPISSHSFSFIHSFIHFCLPDLSFILHSPRFIFIESRYLSHHKFKQFTTKYVEQSIEARD